MSKNNLGVDVVSKGELKQSLKYGIANKKVVFSGVGKTDEEINFALKNNIKQINVESEEELKEICNQAISFKRKINISLRVNPNVDAKTHHKISTGRSEDKFGISEDKIVKVFKYHKENKYLNINGLSIHIGSQICKIAPFRNAFKKIRNLILLLRKHNIFIDSLDIGGGIGIIYEAQKDKVFKISDYALLVEDNFADLGIEIIIEPGRFLVGASGVLISKVIRIKKGKNKDFLIIDAGMNNLLRPSLYSSKHSIFPVKSGNKKIKYDVVGPICETSDIFRKSYLLSKQEKNDLIIICSVGAYGSSMASDYNLRGFAKEVLVEGNKVF
jgi:diaminopimelate decarboxylase